MRRPRMFESSVISLGNITAKIRSIVYAGFESSVISLGNITDGIVQRPVISLRVVSFHWGT